MIHKAPDVFPVEPARYNREVALPSGGTRARRGKIRHPKKVQSSKFELRSQNRTVFAIRASSFDVSKQVPHLGPLGLEVFRIVRIGFGPDGDLLDHLDAVTFEADDLLGIVRKESKLAHAEIEENLRPKTVIAQVGGKAKSRVRFHRIEPLFLQFVSVDFRSQPNATPFLTHIKKDAISFIGDLPQRRVQLITAIATSRAEHIAS